MNAMETMVANILSKLVPPEVIALLSPENIKELKDAAADFIGKISEDLDLIKAQQELIMQSLERLENVDKLNVPNVNSGSNRRRNRGSDSGSASAD